MVLYGRHAATSRPEFRPSCGHHPHPSWPFSSGVAGPIPVGKVFYSKVRTSQGVWAIWLMAGLAVRPAPMPVPARPLMPDRRIRQDPLAHQRFRSSVRVRPRTTRDRRSEVGGRRLLRLSTEMTMLMAVSGERKAVRGRSESAYSWEKHRASKSIEHRASGGVPLNVRPQAAESTPPASCLRISGCS